MLPAQTPHTSCNKYLPITSHVPGTVLAEVRMASKMGINLYPFSTTRLVEGAREVNKENYSTCSVSSCGETQGPQGGLPGGGNISVKEFEFVLTTLKLGWSISQAKGTLFSETNQKCRAQGRAC